MSDGFRGQDQEGVVDKQLWAVVKPGAERSTQQSRPEVAFHLDLWRREVRT